jgi:hypothetical protein
LLFNIRCREIFSGLSKAKQNKTKQFPSPNKNLNLTIQNNHGKLDGSVDTVGNGYRSTEFDGVHNTAKNIGQPVLEGGITGRGSSFVLP